MYDVYYSTRSIHSTAVAIPIVFEYRVVSYTYHEMHERELVVSGGFEWASQNFAKFQEG
eukprot:COSAG02_NODE_4500_length_5288_cov_9.606090_5_plen_59_part_00